MPDPIKNQIIARVVTDLTPLVTNETFRSLTRENDRLRETNLSPRSWSYLKAMVAPATRYGRISE